MPRLRAGSSVWARFRTREGVMSITTLTTGGQVASHFGEHCPNLRKKTQTTEN